MKVLDLFSLKNKVAIVTGGAGLYGRQIVRAMDRAIALVRESFKQGWLRGDTDFANAGFKDQAQHPNPRDENRLPLAASL